MRHHKTKLRHIAPPEREELQAMARSRTLETRLAERARLILALEGSRNYGETAREQHVTRVTVYNWIERFNTLGLAGLEDQPRSGRPPIYGSDEKAEVIATALTKPKDLGLEFGCWTLDRLEVYLNEVKGIGIKRSRIDEILIEEGLRWRKHETWFGERVDPEFAKKRGLLIASTRRHRRTAL
jgi:transposase